MTFAKMEPDDGENDDLTQQHATNDDWKSRLKADFYQLEYRVVL